MSFKFKVTDIHLNKKPCVGTGELMDNRHREKYDTVVLTRRHCLWCTE